MAHLRTACATPISVEVNADARDFQGQKMNLYHYKLSGLQPGTRYYYEVTLSNGESCAASFRTLSDDPDQINLISLSDSLYLRHPFRAGRGGQEL